MTEHNSFIGLPSTVKQKPLQAGKFVGILLAVVLAIGGFFRVIKAPAFIEGPTMGDGQFLALVLLPVVSLGLVFLVSAEAAVSGYRALRSEQSLRQQASASTGYLVLRIVEAGLAVLGLTIMATAVPVLLAESTPAPAGVGIMLLLFAVGLGILFVSFIRSTIELFVSSGST